MTGWKARGTGTCPVCGRTFAKNSRNQKYCGPECKAEQDKRAARRRRADEREGQGHAKGDGGMREHGGEAPDQDGEEGLRPADGQHKQRVSDHALVR